MTARVIRVHVQVARVRRSQSRLLERKWGCPLPFSSVVLRPSLPHCQSIWLLVRGGNILWLGRDTTFLKEEGSLARGKGKKVMEAVGRQHLNTSATRVGLLWLRRTPTPSFLSLIAATFLSACQLRLCRQAFRCQEMCRLLLLPPFAFVSKE